MISDVHRAPLPGYAVAQVSITVLHEIKATCKTFRQNTISFRDNFSFLDSFYRELFFQNLALSFALHVMWLRFCQTLIYQIIYLYIEKLLHIKNIFSHDLKYTFPLFVFFKLALNRLMETWLIFIKQLASFPLTCIMHNLKKKNK